MSLLRSDCGGVELQEVNGAVCLDSSHCKAPETEMPEESDRV